MHLTFCELCECLEHRNIRLQQFNVSIYGSGSLWVWLLVGVVVMSECTVDVEPVDLESCPSSSNGQFHGLMRMNVVHTSLDYCPS